MTNDYTNGATVRLSVTFTDFDSGVLVDPAGVVVKILKPDRSVVSAAPQNPSVGNWHHDVTVDQVGEWAYQFVGTGANASFVESTFTVSEASF